MYDVKWQLHVLKASLETINNCFQRNTTLVIVW